MYDKFTRYYDAAHHFKSYETECARLVSFIRNHLGNAMSLLDVACGTGKHLECLRHSFTVEGADINPNFLTLARQRLPGIPLHEADMMTLNLGKTFDVVTCLFASITCV